jgi:hypothetical protein
MCNQIGWGKLPVHPEAPDTSYAKDMFFLRWDLQFLVNFLTVALRARTVWVATDCGQNTEEYHEKKMV